MAGLKPQELLLSGIETSFGQPKLQAETLASVKREEENLAFQGKPIRGKHAPLQLVCWADTLPRPAGSLVAPDSIYYFHPHVPHQSYSELAVSDSGLMRFITQMLQSSFTTYGQETTYLNSSKSIRS